MIPWPLSSISSRHGVGIILIDVPEPISRGPQRVAKPRGKLFGAVLNEEVNVEGNVGNVKIDMADGETDALVIGAADSPGETGTSKFFGAASFDGGPGASDVLNNAEFGYYAKGFSEKDFEAP